MISETTPLKNTDNIVSRGINNSLTSGGLNIKKDFETLKTKIQNKISSLEQTVNRYSKINFYLKALNVTVGGINSFLLGNNIIDKNSYINRCKYVIYPTIFINTVLPSFISLMEYESIISRLKINIDKLKDLYNDIIRSEIDDSIDKNYSEFFYRETQLI